MVEAIILAGGFGTRLQHVVNDVPKPMAPVNGLPFLAYLLDKLNIAGVTHVILSTGYKHEYIENYFHNKYKSIDISYSRETTPLWTGGAIKLALRLTQSENILVLNGDTLFDIDFNHFLNFHTEQNTNLSVALRPIEQVERYGCVQTNAQKQIIGFSEKGEYKGKGLINGGIYLIKRSLFDGMNLPDKFSFEKEILEKIHYTQSIYGEEFNSYFLDIGIPEDYYKAQQEFPLLQEHKIRKGATLFLDRDGVINKRMVNDYVKKISEFEFLPGVLEAMAVFSEYFSRIFIVTNQQGIAKGCFTDQDLQQVHHYMLCAIQKAGGHIDNIYYCPDFANSNSPNRKPAIGMALQAQKDFPEVDFKNSYMVGDAISDLEFGQNAGMKTIFLTNGEANAEAKKYTRFIYTDLSDFSRNIKQLI